MYKGIYSNTAAFFYIDVIPINNDDYYYSIKQIKYIITYSRKKKEANKKTKTDLRPQLLTLSIIITTILYDIGVVNY